jgi:radical SAM superfamily enzyme YgiQ (UPF0313 family)
MKRSDFRVFLGNPPWSKPGYYGVRAGSRWPHFEEEHLEYMPFPFFLAYAAAVVEGAGFETLLIDGIAEGFDENAFVEKIEDFSPHLVLLEVSTISIDNDIALAKKLRETLGEKVKIAFCGLHNFMVEPEFLEQHEFLDLVLIGEYELTLREVCERLAEGADLSGCLGTIHRSGGIAVEERRPLLDNLDELPWPARHFLPMTNYHDEPGNIPRPSVQMWASRGCPYGCVFCAWPQIMYGSRKYRTRSVIDVVDEMEWLVKEGGYASVYFDDDTFNIGRERMLDFAREVKSRGMFVPFAIMARADNMDRELLEALQEAGLFALKYGVESADPNLLEQCEKKLDINKVRSTIETTHELGIKMHLTFMFGMPAETKETARETMDLALWAKPESVQFTIATPFPGSKYYHMLKEQGRLITDDFSKYDGFRSAVIRTDHLEPHELQGIVAEANQRWMDFYYDRARKRGEIPEATPAEKSKHIVDRIKRRFF